MKAIEVFRNGRKLLTAGLEDGAVRAKLIVRNQIDPVWFDVVGRDRSTGGHEKWARTSVKVTDEFTLRLVDVDPAEVDHVRE